VQKLVPGRSGYKTDVFFIAHSIHETHGSQNPHTFLKSLPEPYKLPTLLFYVLYLFVSSKNTGYQENERLLSR
jgi:hypothetical protein